MATVRQALALLGCMRVEGTSRSKLSGKVTPEPLTEELSTTELEVDDELEVNDEPGLLEVLHKTQTPRIVVRARRPHKQLPHSGSCSFVRRRGHRRPGAARAGGSSRR